jgi:hypothetical protein
LAALSAVSGFMLGQARLQWPAVIPLGTTLAIISAFVLQRVGFEALEGTAVIVACLTLNEAAYFTGVLMSRRETATLET